ncbi:MAG: DUF6448 family protein [Actinomycetota bacterium]
MCRYERWIPILTTFGPVERRIAILWTVPWSKLPSGRSTRGTSTWCFRSCKEEAKEEVRAAFVRSSDARAAASGARELADLRFFETVVRVHRRGENRVWFTG